MKPFKTYLKGKSVFVVSLIVILITIISVYINGEHHARTVTANFYYSLTIIGCALFLFMAYGLYYGVKLIDNFPDFKNFKIGRYINSSGEAPNVPFIDASDGIGGLVISIIAWIGMTILAFVFLILLEFAFWLSIFIIIMLLYWLFFRALKLVFSKAPKTKGNIGLSLSYALAYTSLYLGWLFLTVYLAQKF
ncbi:MAG: hypothetical protein BM549_03195 [Lacinutrix sp. MedPE-SW]|nr:MAG: hypothetical protein BM549_03195 [Lacinutrix sp. MedPE-SW]